MHNQRKLLSRKHLIWALIFAAFIAGLLILMSSLLMESCATLQRSRVESPVEAVPVYNILAVPKSNLDPLILLPNTETTIKFFIGPQSDESLTPAIKPGDIFKELAARGPLDLTVTLFCNLSETNTYQQRRIKYDPDIGRSNSAEFTVVPSLAAVRDNDGVGRLIFVLDANGMEVDIIQVNAIVGEPTTAALERYRRPVKLMLDNILPEDIAVPDLIIAIAPQAEKKIPVVIRPMNSELLQRLQEELNDQENSFWIFKSGVNAKDLEGLVANAYKELLAISDQNQEGLQEAYKQIGIETETSGRVSFGSFDKADTDRILRTVSRRGRLLYGRIFRGDENLIKAMKVINSFELDRPLRLKILAEDVYIPWQILYPDFQNSLEAKQFWGFRYELGTLQLANQAHGRTRTVIKNLRPGEVLYGAWRGVASNTSDDDVKELANLLKEHLEKSIGTDIQFCPSKADFLSEIESGAETIKIILAYGHGSSGTVLFEYTDSTGNRIPITVSSALGPYFKFAEGDNETLVPDDIDYLALPYIDDSIYPYLFKSQPIIILNACETGTSGTRSPDNNGFVGALARAGARAIIVTEAPVGGNFAYVFGQQIIDSLLDGDEAQSAMLKVRLNHLEKAGNPLGLLYSLYGNPAARIEKN